MIYASVRIIVLYGSEALQMMEEVPLLRGLQTVHGVNALSTPMSLGAFIGSSIADAPPAPPTLPTLTLEPQQVGPWTELTHFRVQTIQTSPSCLMFYSLVVPRSITVTLCLYVVS